MLFAQRGRRICWSEWNQWIFNLRADGAECVQERLTDGRTIFPKNVTSQQSSI